MHSGLLHSPVFVRNEEVYTHRTLKRNNTLAFWTGHIDARTHKRHLSCTKLFLVLESKGNDTPQPVLANNRTFTSASSCMLVRTTGAFLAGSFEKEFTYSP